MRLSGRHGWLIVVDMQNAFMHSDSPWFTPGIGAVADRIADLIPLFANDVIFTRFVPPARSFGSWHAYYEKWPFARETNARWLWDLDDRWTGRESVATHRFSKWVPDLITRLGEEPTIVLCGVSTDCCVLATALAAVDDGAHVRVIVDACAAKSPSVHRNALDLMAARAPQLELATIAEESQRHAASVQESPS